MQNKLQYLESSVKTFEAFEDKIKNEKLTEQKLISGFWPHPYILKLDRTRRIKNINKIST